MSYLAYRTKLYCSSKAKEYLFGAAGARRFAWNWSLAESRKAWIEEKKTLSEYDLINLFNSIKKEQFPWIYQYSKWIPQLAAESLWNAQKRAFKLKKGFPKFKKKHNTKPSFQVSFPALRVDKKNPLLLHLASCDYSFRISKPIRFSGKIRRATFTYEPDGWYISLQIDVDSNFSYHHICKSQAVCGIDVGITTSITVSDEVSTFKLNTPDLKKLENRLCRAQRRLAHKQKNSKNRLKAKTKVALVHQKIRRVRADFQHRVTASLVERYRKIGIETLNIIGMLKNRCLSRSISCEGWGDFRRKLEYKSKLSGSAVVLADRFFPSSRLCSVCGLKNEKLNLSNRSWICSCGQVHDRDENAAKNLRNLAEGYSERINDCGGNVRPDVKAVRRQRKAISDEAVK